ncbi:MAG: hypothetical protein ACRCX2_04240 [Paraclostridium sp.]
MKFKFVDIMPKDDKGYMTLKDYIVKIVAYLSKAMDYNDYFNSDEMLTICTHIFDEFFMNKNNYNFDYRFWLCDEFELLNVATNSLYIDYTNDDNYGGKIFPDHVRNSDKELIDKIDKYLKDNGKYSLEPHDFDHNKEFYKHMNDFCQSEDTKEYLRSIGIIK